MKVIRRLILSVITIVLLSTVSVFAADSVINNSTGNKTLKAKWNVIDYSITYNLNGGSISGQKTSYTVKTDTFTLPTPTRSGYTFTGWSGTGLTGSSNKTVTVAKGSTGNRSYTANWKNLLESSALKFSSDANFILRAPKQWNGTLEYSINNGSTWTTWDGSQLSGTATQPIYLRGTGNSTITGGGYIWTFTGKYCTGNIENLLDYQTVANDKHPVMGKYCYQSMFRNCKFLTTAPDLLATTLTVSCYRNMFQSCSSLTTAPTISATTLALQCCCEMFDGCISLTTAPALPATKLSEQCYTLMFNGCTSLKTAPALPATTLADWCYRNMFKGCTSLKTAPVLPAMTLTEYCYANMFEGCTSLTTPPALPAKTLAERCYDDMFLNCTKLTTVPALPATTLADWCYYYMFNGCKSLKMSTTQTGEYKYAYRIPMTGSGTTAAEPFIGMFHNTGGVQFDPKINTTYYTTNPPVQ